MLRGYGTPVNAKEQYNWSEMRTYQEDKDEVAREIYTKKTLKKKKWERQKQIKKGTKNV